MALFQLDPQSIATRARADNPPARPPTLGKSVFLGIFGFTVVSVAGFAPWAFFGGWFYPRVGEAGLYATCAAVFIVLSGLCLHRLIIGPGSLSRFYKIFGIAFTVYAAVWIICWLWLGGDKGSIAGLLGGTVAMGALLAWAFDAPRAALKTMAALFLLNTLGYFVGGWVEAKLIVHHQLAAMLLWGVCYGIGFGAGLGLAFYWCQEEARELIAGTRGEGDSTP